MRCREGGGERGRGGEGERDGEREREREREREKEGGEEREKNRMVYIQYSHPLIIQRTSCEYEFSKLVVQVMQTQVNTPAGLLRIVINPTFWAVLNPVYDYSSYTHAHKHTHTPLSPSLSLAPAR